MSSQLPKLTRVGTYSTDDTAPLKGGSIEYVEVFPPIGITRFGDSESEYFLTPEIPSRAGLPGGISGFRDPQQRIRRQAVRFRAYAYDANDNLLGEVNSQNGYTLTWTVHVANKKAAFTVFQGRFTDPPRKDLRNPKVQPNVDPDLRTQLIVDPGERSISSPGAPNPPENLVGNFFGSTNVATPISLGQLQVDAAGRLIFVPGNGHAQSIKDPNDPRPEIISEFDSIDWIDTACDGWVRVAVTGPNITSINSRYDATVISAPPNFAWGINAPTTLYDIMEDIYWRERNGSITLDIENHISPVLKSASLISWTNNTALQGHGPFTNGYFISNIDSLLYGGSKEVNVLRTRIFNKLRKPNYEDRSQASVQYMPRLSGDSGDLPEPGEIPSTTNLTSYIRRFAALTQLQYKRFEKWSRGEGQDMPTPANLCVETCDPLGLMRASLESTIGDPLFPGIEVYWLAKDPKIYRLGGEYKYQTYGFRVNHPSVKCGHLTRGLSLPWQCDFMLCEWHWWPCVRPDNVVLKAAYDNTIGDSGTPEQFKKAVTARKDWTRGFRNDIQTEGRGRASTTNPWPQSTDMVRHWHHLGIVREYERKGKLAYVESERLGL